MDVVLAIYCNFLVDFVVVVVVVVHCCCCCFDTSIILWASASSLLHVVQCSNNDLLVAAFARMLNVLLDHRPRLVAIVSTSISAALWLLTENIRVFTTNTSIFLRIHIGSCMVYLNFAKNVSLSKIY